MSCQSLVSSERRTSPITVRNQTNETIFLLNDCGTDVPDRMTLDGAPVFAPPDVVSCDDFLEGICVPPPFDCARSMPVEIAAGASVDVAWDGRTRRATAAPSSCFPDTCPQGTPKECVQIANVPDGAHEIGITFARGDAANPPERATATATFPTSSLVVLVD